MTFLQLVQRTRQECGIAGDGPTTVIGQTKSMKRLVEWVSQSWTEIQEECPDFQFLRKDVSFSTVIGQQAYVAGSGLGINITDFGTWLEESFRIYLTATGVSDETELNMTDYTAFRDYYLLGSQRTISARPSDITIAPNRSLLLAPLPDAVYTVNGEYYRSPQELVYDTDVPLMPSRFHMLIVYRAMQKYGYFESANEQIAAGEKGYGMMFNRLVLDQSPPVSYGNSLI